MLVVVCYLLLVVALWCLIVGWLMLVVNLKNPFVDGCWSLVLGGRYVGQWSIGGG